MDVLPSILLNDQGNRWSSEHFHDHSDAPQAIFEVSRSHECVFVSVRIWFSRSFAAWTVAKSCRAGPFKQRKDDRSDGVGTNSKLDTPALIVEKYSWNILSCSTTHIGAICHSLVTFRSLNCCVDIRKLVLMDARSESSHWSKASCQWIHREGFWIRS